MPQIELGTRRTPTRNEAVVEVFGNDHGWAVTRLHHDTWTDTVRSQARAISSSLAGIAASPTNTRSSIICTAHIFPSTGRVASSATCFPVAWATYTPAPSPGTDTLSFDRSTFHSEATKCVLLQFFAQLGQYLEKIQKIKEEDIKDKIYHTPHGARSGVATRDCHGRVCIDRPLYIGVLDDETQDVSEAILIDPLLVLKLKAIEQVAEAALCPAEKDQHTEDDARSSEDSDTRTLVDDAPLDGSPNKRCEPQARISRRVGDYLNAFYSAITEISIPWLPPQSPPFWSISFREGPRRLPLVQLIQLICAILFGVVHCLAWNTSFPSIIEMWMWRICALLIVGLPLLCFSLLLLCNVFEHGSAPRRVLTYFNYVLIALYVIARLALLILLFTTLRDLPQRIFVDVPHI
ncbi:hypothetical protein B0H14DRAFT_2643048 [Mycena olivaceomarginata]|nr:hypothetical protein B0H14DRAFT_2643048 [Mycena olivaceomarginata]